MFTLNDIFTNLMQKMTAKTLIEISLFFFWLLNCFQYIDCKVLVAIVQADLLL